jgi:hypothetical protein
MGDDLLDFVVELRPVNHQDPSASEAFDFDVGPQSDDLK